MPEQPVFIKRGSQAGAQRKASARRLASDSEDADKEDGTSAGADSRAAGRKRQQAVTACDAEEEDDVFQVKKSKASRQMSKGKMPHLSMLRAQQAAASEKGEEKTVGAGGASEAAVETGGVAMEVDAVAGPSESEDEAENFNAQKSRLSRQLRKGSVPLVASSIQKLGGSTSTLVHKSAKLPRRAPSAAELEALAASSGDEAIQPAGRAPAAKPPAQTEMVNSDDDELDAIEALIRQQRSEAQAPQPRKPSQAADVAETLQSGKASSMSSGRRSGAAAAAASTGVSKVLSPAAAMAQLWDLNRKIQAKVEEHERRMAELLGMKEEAETMLAKVEREEKQLLT
eukprot:CAMPEP_0178410076 /NCGR_PEP_ID=MMETSP0689_2-20121128/20792_1 /TAXON_ID=160604 /ORGANISM="Amphidinium massartii, Strain CS-259" /LENGTH=341 /DNA_ID=CAMNT_0020031239 /DNA_START=258 /DNA_END=1280 /DNA_ORIENTATION=-